MGTNWAKWDIYGKTWISEIFGHCGILKKETHLMVLHPSTTYCHAQVEFILTVCIVSFWQLQYYNQLGPLERGASLFPCSR